MSTAESAVEVFTSLIILVIGIFILGQLSAATGVELFGGFLPTLSAGFVSTAVPLVVVLMIVFVFVGAVYDLAS